MSLQTATLNAEVHAALIAAGYPESTADGLPLSEERGAAAWSAGFLVSEYNPGSTYVAYWDQVFTKDRTPAQVSGHYANISMMREALRAAGFTVRQEHDEGAATYHLIVCRA